MAKFLFKLMPERASFYAHVEANYPEVHPLDLYTHMWIRVTGSVVEDAVENFLGDHGISSGRFMTLMILEGHKEGLKPSVLANHLGVTQATITGLLDGLEHMGLAKRCEHANDGRACVVILTEKGQSYISTVRPEFNRWVGNIYSCYTTEEKEQLIRLMEKCFRSRG